MGWRRRATSRAFASRTANFFARENFSHRARCGMRAIFVFSKIADAGFRLGIRASHNIKLRCAAIRTLTGKRLDCAAINAKCRDTFCFGPACRLRSPWPLAPRIVHFISVAGYLLPYPRIYSIAVNTTQKNRDRRTGRNTGTTHIRF